MKKGTVQTEPLRVDDDVLAELVERYPDTDVRGSLAREVMARRAAAN